MSKTTITDQLFSQFAYRHIGPQGEQVNEMLEEIGYSSLDDLSSKALPEAIQFSGELDLKPSATETEALAELRSIAKKNKIFKSFIGMGYYGCIVPAVIQRNILENPGWYTQYTPYQSEISQGRMESLLNFQTMVSDLTGLDIANASLLDEPTAAAEAMALSIHAAKKGATHFFIAKNCHPQTIAVVKTRAEALGVELIVGDPDEFSFDKKLFGVILQTPDTEGLLKDYGDFIRKAKENGAIVSVAVDLLALTLTKDPGSLGCDIAFGSAQRFGVPMGFGGPHAAFFATKDEFKRKVPGRIIGVSKDREGKPALRLALQTREQHIRREKATSNICTAQALLANMAAMYAVYHGPEGLKSIARSVHQKTCFFARSLEKAGFKLAHQSYFDTILIKGDQGKQSEIRKKALSNEVNLRYFENGDIGISFDETTSLLDLDTLLSVFEVPGVKVTDEEIKKSSLIISNNLQRDSEFMTAKVFQEYHSETELMRYIKRLENRDLSLTASMIPLGSCTMKLNAVSELYPVSWPEFSSLHPFIPDDQSQGYQELFKQLEYMLCEVTGFDAVSLQPNSGAQGEFAGLLVIKAFQSGRGEGHRNICLIPSSAHGTNPASAIMAGYKVVVVKCDENGNIDLQDLTQKAEQHKESLAAMMVTYPSTHGVFEHHIKEVCQVVHDRGGQVYMDGANLNAQVGLCRPGEFGPDVCHMNLHKTFCIPHGGGGPGMGPIAVKSHLANYLPSHPFTGSSNEAAGTISGAPYGSASILPISWMYIRMMAADGLKRATEIAILNANYIASRLREHFEVLYRGNEGLVAHECIIDLRPLKAKASIEVDDIAKRLIDYGFHAPTVSFPVPGTMMIEPTESESKKEIDRFCEAMIAIRNEIRAIESGEYDKKDNPLKNAPHTASMLVSETWPYPYSKEVAVFPTSEVKQAKFWPYVARVDNAYGDRHLMCSCAPIEDYQ